MTMDWYWKSASEISAAVRSGVVSASDITEAQLRRIDEVDGRIDAYTQRWDDTARAMAAKVDEKASRGEALGPLAGVPVALKELLCTRTGKTTCASKMLEHFRSPYDATVVKRLEAADAIFLGKVNMDEFAMGSSTENSAIKVTRNPWNLKCVPGGSSGGSAAAVSAGECAISLGSDTGGSIRQPAAYCGVTGFKPSYGVVSRYGLVAYASSLDQVGPLAADARDCAALTDLMRGLDPLDSTSAALPDQNSLLAQCTGEIAGLRVGLPEECFADGLDPELRAAVLAVGDALAARGASLVPVRLPALKYAIPAYYVLACAEASSNLSRYDGVKYGYRADNAQDVLALHSQSRTQGFGREVRRRILLGAFVLSSGYYDAFYGKAVKAQKLLKRQFAEAFTQADVLLSPVAPGPAPLLGESLSDPMKMYLSDIYTVSVNLAGLPAAAVPCGFTKGGLPIGAQLIGPRFADGRVLRAADAFQRQTDFHLYRPEVNA